MNWFEKNILGLPDKNKREEEPKLKVGLKWEYATNQSIRRSKIHRGWLVETYTNSEAGSGGLTFVEDLNHMWNWELKQEGTER